MTAEQAPRRRHDDDFVTHKELREHLALIPEQVAAAIEKKRIENRWRVARNFFKLAMGVAGLLASVAVFLGWLGVHPG